jgi:hypothetical protein
MHPKPEEAKNKTIILCIKYTMIEDCDLPRKPKNHHNLRNFIF